MLLKITSKGKKPARVITRARILLKTDQSEKGPGWRDEQISEALEVTVQTVERVRKQLVEEGLDRVLTRRPLVLKKPRTKIDGRTEAYLIAISCGEPPTGHAKWSLRLLAEKLVKLEYVDSVSHETVRATLKKTS